MKRLVAFMNLIENLPFICVLHSGVHRQKFRWCPINRDSGEGSVGPPPGKFWLLMS